MCVLLHRSRPSGPKTHLCIIRTRCKVKPQQTRGKTRFVMCFFSHMQAMLFCNLCVFFFSCLHSVSVTVSVCAVLLVLLQHPEEILTRPSVDRASALSVTPLPATPLDSGQCAKQLCWKRPRAFFFNRVSA